MNDYPPEHIVPLVLVLQDGEVVQLPLVYIGDEIPDISVSN